jgi:two-component system, NarL family, response regulator DegU
MDKIRLLIADDHQLFQNGLRLILKDALGIDAADFAVNGKEAIVKCRQQRFDVVVMDINMPIIDGIEATHEIKMLHPDTKILIVSMMADLTHVKNAMKAGADGFLIKNADATEFVKAFHAIQHDQIYLSDYFQDLLHADKNTTRNEYIKFSENIITSREKSVLKMICEGLTNAEIAETLFLSVATVNTHRNNMLAKLSLPNTASLVRFALDNKLV